MIKINDLTPDNTELDSTLSDTDMAEVSGGSAPQIPVPLYKEERKIYLGYDFGGYVESGYDPVAWNELDKEGIANGDRTG